MSRTAMFSSRWRTDDVPGISRMFGRKLSSHARPIWAGVRPRRAAMLATCGLRRTGLPRAKAEPSGKNGTKAISRASHSSSTGRECLAAVSRRPEHLAMSGWRLAVQAGREQPHLSCALYRLGTILSKDLGVDVAD